MMVEKLFTHLRSFIVINRFITPFVIALLFLPLILAEELVLITNEQIDYKGINIGLLSVGSSGSIALKVDKTTFSLSKDEEKSAFNLNFKLLETSFDTAKISVVQTVQCIIDEDCNDNNDCTKDTCTVHNDCAFQKIEGCNDDSCFSIGETQEKEKQQYYCSSELIWQKRKLFNQECFNNYECISNICLDKKCRESKESEKQMTVKA